MSETVAHTALENYKGTLQQYCQKRALVGPVYEAVHQGTPNEPSWAITVTYGEVTYTTPEPIRGSKRFAEHMAAKQILESIESHQDAFLAGTVPDEIAQPDDITQLEEAAKLTAEAPTVELLHVPTELVTTALGIANHRLVELRRGTRYRDSVDSKQGNQAFAQSLATLTIQLVREVVNAAEASNVKFGDIPQPEAKINE